MSDRIEGTPDVVRELVRDAELVADVAVRLGRLKDPKLLSDLKAARLAAGSDADSLDTVVELQKSLNAAISDIAPITLRDIRLGWSPFAAPKLAHGYFFGFCAIVLICVTAYMTLLYNRASFAHTSLIELQTNRVSEQTAKLFDIFRKNEPAMRTALASGATQDILIDSFYKNYFDLQSTNDKLTSVVSMSSQLASEGAIFTRCADLMIAAWRLVSGPLHTDSAKDKTSAEIAKRENSYRSQGVDVVVAAMKSAPATSGDTIIGALNAFFFNLTGFVDAIGLKGADPRAPIPLFLAIWQMNDILNVFGLWYLPALYGMLGSVVFHMRRYLDPNIPNPTMLRFTFRLFLGAFAGIIVVWFWAPSSQKNAEQAFSTLSAFGVAFLVGFSIDVFFQGLDRLVTYVGQAIGKPA
jgi:hypothetical protein